MLEALQCTTCGSNNLIWENKVLVCKHCGTKFILHEDNSKNYNSKDKVNGNNTAKLNVDPELLHSLEMCEKLEAMRDNYFKVSIHSSGIDVKIREANTDIEASKRNIRIMENEKGKKTGITIGVCTLLAGMGIANWVLGGFTKDSATGMAILLFLCVCFLVWRLCKIADITEMITNAQETIKKLQSTILDLEKNKKETEVELERLDKEIENYIKDEMMPKCKIPEDFWSCTEEIRKNITKGYIDLDSAIRRLEKKHGAKSYV